MDNETSLSNDGQNTDGGAGYDVVFIFIIIWLFVCYQSFCWKKGQIRRLTFQKNARRIKKYKKKTSFVRLLFKHSSVNIIFYVLFTEKNVENTILMALKIIPSTTTQILGNQLIQYFFF